MDISATSLPEVLCITLDVFTDERGFFVELYRDERFASAGLPTTWRQDNHSSSRRGVLRGLHYQHARPQGKLVACISGSIFDVAVDLRAGSPTFRRWAAVTLSEDTPQLLWIPPGFAHGFCALSDLAHVTYKCTEVYVPDDERGIVWNDPELAIDWPIAQPIVSGRDRAFPRLSQAASELPRFVASLPR